MRESAAFRLQARNDLAAAAQLGGGACSSQLRNQVLAKAQQAVEKIVKAAVIILSDAGVLVGGLSGNPSSNARAPQSHAVAKYADSIALFLTSSGGGTPLPAHTTLAKLFTSRRRAVIAELDGLAPGWPIAGALHKINSEYPFEIAAKDWTYPGEENTFTARRTLWLLDEVISIVDALDRNVTAIERMYPPPPP